MTTRSKLIAYIAGIVDGEGSINISRCLPSRDRKYVEKLPRFEIAVVVTNTNEKLFPVLNQFEQGSLIKKKRYNESHKQGYNWVLKGEKAIRFLKLIKKYLILKREQAELMIKFEKEKKRHKVDDREFRKREMIWLKMKELNDNRSCND